MAQLRISAKTLGELALPEFCPRCFWLKLHSEEFRGRTSSFLKGAIRNKAHAPRIREAPITKQRAFRDALRCRARFRARGQEKADVVRFPVR